jgi:hypothetical protein
MKSEMNAYYNKKMGTYKLFLIPKNINNGDLGSIKFLRMLFANNKHAKLFGKNVGKNIDNGNDDIVVDDKDFKHYIIKNTSELFKIICGDKQNSTFTYCYKSDGRLYLCKTEGEKDDNKCKHAWLCNKIYGIVSAGIMMFSKKGNKIYIDNMSGTYKTQESNLEIIKTDLENSFSGIKIKLLKSPLENERVKKIYCSVMKSDSVDYNSICKQTSKRRQSNKRRQTSKRSQRNKRKTIKK